MDMKFPRYIFTIGGAGKDLMFSMLKKEWIVKEILRPKPTPTVVDITVIDTATEEENEVSETIKEIEKNIDRISGEYGSSLTDPSLELGRIRISYELLTSKMTLTTPSSLVGIGQEIKNAKLANVWWINDPEMLGNDWLDKVMDHENIKHLDFSKGVYRKRAISKAIYFKALSENLFKPNVLRNDQVAIIAGLGGGTGSGISIDLAKRIKTIQPMANVTLFGILSTIEESDDEKSNNFAMLTELEYTFLNKNKNLFKNVVLVPIEKTKYPGKLKTTHAHQKLLEEFDKTFAYVFISYHNTGPGERLFSNLPDYAPFIIATSQLVHYNIDAIKRFKEQLVNVLKGKEKSFEDEEKIYGIAETIDEFYNNGDAKLFEQDEIFIADRFSKFEVVMNHKIFDDLRYESVSQLKKAVDAGIAIANMESVSTAHSDPGGVGRAENTNSSNLEMRIASIASQVQNFPATTYKDDIDPILYNILKKDIEMIKKRVSVVKSINKINDIGDSKIKLALKSIIKNDQFSLGLGQQQISKEISQLSEVQRQTEIKTKEWKQTNIKDIDRLNTIDELYMDWSKNLIYIKNGLSEYATRLNSVARGKDINTIDILDAEKILDKMYQDMLNKIDVEFKDKSTILESITYLKELRRNQLEAAKDVKMIHRLTGKARSVKQKIKNEVDRITVEIDRRKVFKVKEDGTFVSIYSPDIEDKINKLKDDVIGKMISSVKGLFPNISNDAILNIKNDLKDYSKRKSVIIEDQLGVSARLVILKAFEARLNAIAPVMARYSNNIKEYHGFIDNMESNVEKMRNEKKKTIYVTEAQPKNLFRIMAEEMDINGMIKNAQEMTNLKSCLNDGLTRTLDNNYNVLALSKIETNSGTKVWNKTRVMSSLVTVANIGPNDINAEKQIRDTFNPGGYADWVCGWSDPWEVGIVLFIAGVPLDNIKNVVDSKEGYYVRYKSQEPKTFFYHSLMLEEGNLVRRKNVLNLESEDEKLLLLQGEEEVRKLCSDNHEIVPIKDCL